MYWQTLVLWIWSEFYWQIVQAFFPCHWILTRQAAIERNWKVCLASFGSEGRYSWPMQHWSLGWTSLQACQAVARVRRSRKLALTTTPRLWNKILQKDLQWQSVQSYSTWFKIYVLIYDLIYTHQARLQLQQMHSHSGMLWCRAIAENPIWTTGQLQVLQVSSRKSRRIQVPWQSSTCIKIHGHAFSTTRWR